MPEVPLDRFLAALAEPTRLRLALLLAEGELCVCDLVDVVRASQPAISRHLAALRSAGLAAARRQGKWMHYRLLPQRGERARLLDAILAAAAGTRGAQRDMAARARCCTPAPVRGESSKR